MKFLLVPTFVGEMIGSSDDCEYCVRLNNVKKTRSTREMSLTLTSSVIEQAMHLDNRGNNFRSNFKNGSY